MGRSCGVFDAGDVPRLTLPYPLAANRPPRVPPTNKKTKDCCVARTPAAHEAALASFAGYCRRRTLKELEEELEIAAELAAQAAAEDVQIYQ
jgi:hypothetical protein